MKAACELSVSGSRKGHGMQWAHEQIHRMAGNGLLEDALGRKVIPSRQRHLEALDAHEQVGRLAFLHSETEEPRYRKRGSQNDISAISCDSTDKVTLGANDNLDVRS